MRPGALGLPILLPMLSLMLLGCVEPAARPTPPPTPVAAPVAPPVTQAPPAPLSDVPADPAAPRGPLTLDGAIREALAGSPEVAAAERRAEAAREQIREADAAFSPRLSVVSDYTATDNPVYALMSIINQRRLSTTVDFNHPGTQQNIGSRLEGSLSLFEGGRNLADRRAATQRAEAAASETAAARNRLVASTVETWYRWLQALGVLGAAEQSLDAAKADEALGDARVRAGAALASEALRLRTRTAEARADLVSAKTRARRMKAAMERLIARPLADAETPALAPEPPPPETTAGADQAALVAQALARRPETAAAEAVVRAAQERVASARGEFFPKVALRGNYGWDTKPLGGPTGESWLFGLTAGWSVFEGGASLARLRQAQAQVKEMEQRGRQVALDIALEVAQAAAGVEEAAERRKVAEERRGFASLSLSEVRSLYRRDAVTVDALLQSEAAASGAEAALAAAAFEERIALARLRLALGDFANSATEESR